MSERTQKVNQQIKEEVGSFLQTHLSDHSGLVTITAVETASDLRSADVWYSYIGSDLEIFEAELAKNKSAIQRATNSKLTMKYSPKLIFKLDKSGEYVREISNLIEKAKNEYK